MTIFYNTLLSVCISVHILFLSGCEQQESGKEFTVYVEKELTSDVAVLFTKKRFLNEKGEEVYFYIGKTEFFSPKSPETTKIEFNPTATIYGNTSRYLEDILSPDKKWVILKAGSMKGLVYCQAKDLLECVKTGEFEGRINFEYMHDGEDLGDLPITEGIGWEAPATYVFYEVDRDTDREPCPEKEIYKVNLETGEFTYPLHPNPVIKPVLRKNAK